MVKSVYFAVFNVVAIWAFFLRGRVVPGVGFPSVWEGQIIGLEFLSTTVDHMDSLRGWDKG